MTCHGLYHIFSHVLVIFSLIHDDKNMVQIVYYSQVHTQQNSSNHILYQDWANHHNILGLVVTIRACQTLPMYLTETKPQQKNQQRRENRPFSNFRGIGTNTPQLVPIPKNRHICALVQLRRTKSVSCDRPYGKWMQNPKMTYIALMSDVAKFEIIMKQFSRWLSDLDYESPR